MCAECDRPLAHLAAVGLADGIQSANVVGYQTKQTVSGFNFLAPTFEPVDGTGYINIQDIKISGENMTDSVDNLQILDEGGATTATYFYMTKETSGLEADGWVDGDLWALTDVSLPCGAGVLIDTANDGVDVTFAGQVSTTDTEVESVTGFNFTGNNSPAVINIQDILIVGENVTDSVDNLQILDEGGATIATYFYMTKETSGLEADGWVDGDLWALADMTIEPGQGVLIDTANDGVIISIPAAL